MALAEALALWRAGNIDQLDLRSAAMADLSLRTVHAVMGIPEVRDAFGDVTNLDRVGAASGPRTSPSRRVGLVLRTWAHPPPGGWLLAISAWARLLALEAMADGGAVAGLDEDRLDPSPAIRTWAVLVRDVVGDLDGVRAHLTDPDPAVRLVAASALFARGARDPDVVTALCELIDVASCGDEAIAVVGPLYDPRALPGLLRAWEARRSRAALSALAFVEALPILERELFDGMRWEAARAVEALGPRAGALAGPVVDRIAGYLREPLVSDVEVSGSTRRRWPHEEDCLGLLEVLRALGPAAADAAPMLLDIAARTERESRGFVELASAEAAGSASDEARRVLAGWLDSPDEVMRLRALHGLAAGGPASAPWREGIARRLDDPSDVVRVEAAVALARLGDTRSARAAWLDFEAWPLRHHGTYPGLHRLAAVLIRDLPTTLDESDPDDVALTVRALETMAVDQPSPVTVIHIEGDPDIAARRVAFALLLRLRTPEG